MFKKIIGLGFSTKGKKAKDVEKYIWTLAKWGADEFFVGYNPPYWHEKFGFEVSPNGRFAEHEQVTDFETLKMIVEQAHKHNIEIFWNLNFWYYTDETFPLIKKMVEEFIEVWLDWIICANIGILEYLKQINYSWKINISTIMAVYNKEAIRFLLENYDINKIILSREITLKEIEEILKEFPETKFEVFWEWDFCRYNNWLCFAEHKYWAKDICTVVQDDLIIKKKFRPDFKEFILDENLSNNQKIEKMNDEYKDIFEQIEEILSLWTLPLSGTPLEKGRNKEEDLEKIILQNKDRVDLFFDALKPINDKRNKNILTFLKWVKYLITPPPSGTPLEKGRKNKISEENLEILKKLEEELNHSAKTALEYHIKKVKELGWEPKIKAEILKKLYSKWDNLNLYTYLFFSKFPNIDTVKFPTRWRDYNEKIKIITDVINTKNVKKYLDRWISIERTHYDLTYLFWDKLRFRKMLEKEF